MRNKNQATEIKRYVKALRDSEGYACINIMLDAETDIYNPLSVGENLDLSSDIYDFIEAQSNIIPAQIPLKICFCGRIVQPEEQEKIRQIMRRHYTIKSYDITWDKAANFRKMLGLTIFGVVVLAAYFAAAFLTDKALTTEILSIISSFSLWEAANSFLLERPRLRREYENISQNISQTVEFLPNKE